MKLHELQGKKILIAGYGVEGKATHAYLQKHLSDAVIGIADKSSGEDYLAVQKNYDIAIRSPGMKPDLLTIPYTTATNIFFAEVKGKTIGVTGTKGKSTTASLIAHILKTYGSPVQLVGNIGVPMLTAIQEQNDEAAVYVVELSSYQLVDISYTPHISVIINLYHEHMDYHGSVESYWEAKLRMIAHATSSSIFIYNDDFKKLLQAAKKTIATTLPFVSSLPFSADTIPLLGAHNRDNVRAALTVARHLGIPDATTKKAVMSFKALPHRLMHVGTYGGIIFYDDAISTTPESTMFAIDAFENVGTIFLGGQDRGYHFRQLVKKLEARQVPNIVLFPDSGEAIKKFLDASPTYHPRVLMTRSMQEAVKFAYIHTPKGSICLLSCASPSYSLWKNFEEKGNEFQKYVTHFQSS